VPQRLAPDQEPRCTDTTSHGVVALGGAIGGGALAALVAASVGATIDLIECIDPDNCDTDTMNTAGVSPPPPWRSRSRSWAS
jgi:hypothetical protein